MALAWIAVDVQVAQRKVTHRVVELLRESGGCPADCPRTFLRTSATGLLVGLWGGVGQNCSDGDITDVPDSLIEEWAGWPGIPGAFATWVREKHAVEGKIRDWDEMNGSLETRREKDKERKRLEREHQRVLRTSRGQSTGPAQPVRATAARTNQPTNQPTNQEERQGSGTAAPPPDDPPPAKQNLPVRTDRAYATIVAHIGAVLTEVHEGERSELTADQQRTVCAELVFAYWASKTNQKQAMYDNQRERRLKLRLEENRINVSELMYAVDGAMKDAWHNGKKDGTRHLGIDQIFRNRETVERLAGSMGGYVNGEPHVTAVKYRAVRADAVVLPEGEA